MPTAPSERHRLDFYIDLLAREGLVSSVANDQEDPVIGFATDDSREVGPQTLFVCKGRAFKREYLVSAVEAGAVAYLS